MRVVLDTNILVRSHKNAQGPARGCFERLQTEHHTLLISQFLLSELARVLTYPRVMVLHRLSTTEISEFLSAVLIVGAWIETPQDFAEIIVTADPDDDPIVQLAILGKAAVLCTLDRHLRSTTVREHCGNHGIRILTDVELLDEFRRDEPNV